MIAIVSIVCTISLLDGIWRIHFLTAFVSVFSSIHLYTIRSQVWTVFSAWFQFEVIAFNWIQSCIRYGCYFSTSADPYTHIAYFCALNTRQISMKLSYSNNNFNWLFVVAAKTKSIRSNGRCDSIWTIEIKMLLFA